MYSIKFIVSYFVKKNKSETVSDAAPSNLTSFDFSQTSYSLFSFRDSRKRSVSFLSPFDATIAGP
jgi:hypothetical protein